MKEQTAAHQAARSRAANKTNTTGYTHRSCVAHKHRYPQSIRDVTLFELAHTYCEKSISPLGAPQVNLGWWIWSKRSPTSPGTPETWPERTRYQLQTKDRTDQVEGSAVARLSPSQRRHHGQSGLCGSCGFHTCSLGRVAGGSYVYNSPPI